MEGLKNPDSEILRRFLELHKGKPLFILCKKCHREYDENKISVLNI
jgi:hypothetical protein